MRRFAPLALVTVVALVVTGFAIAHEQQARKTEAVAATFTASTERVQSRQCTGADGVYDVTHAVYRGTATGDARLTGQITIKTKSVVNRTSGLGTTKGYVLIRDADGRLKAKAHLGAVVSQHTALNGLARGKVKNGGHLLANVTATFNLAGATLSGELGSGTGQNTAVVTSGSCDSHDDDDHKRGERRKDD